jgi:hypothetical protein
MPAQPASEFWDWWNNRPMSQHFVVGTSVKIAHEPPAEVIARPGNGYMTIRHEDGREETHRPLGLQWERDEVTNFRV